jgi:L-cysteine desulfidase
MNKNELYDLLYSDLVNTMGCTDVGAVGFAAAKAASYLKGELISVDLILSDLLYKNSLRVGIPGTFKSGVHKAILIGYLLKNPEKALSVFEDATDDISSSLVKLENIVKVNISYEKKEDPLYIDITLHSDKSKVRVLMLHSYDNIQEVYIDDELHYVNEHPKVFKADTKCTINTNLDEIFQYILSADSDLNNLIDFAETNYNTALIDLTDKELPNITGNNIIRASEYVRKYVLSACFLRMKGAAVPVTGVAGSGNLGITTLTSAYILGKMFNANEIQLKQGLALAVLVSTYMKRKMTLLTTICGSALSGGAGVAATTAFLLGGNIDQIKNAINILIAINAGTLCDGAKKSCSFKVAFSAENGVTAGKMAVDGECFEDENGINKPDVEKTIQNIANINNEALDDARTKILTLL